MNLSIIDCYWFPRLIIAIFLVVDLNIRKNTDVSNFYFEDMFYEALECFKNVHPPLR